MSALNNSTDTISSNSENEENLVKLSLNKPKEWDWELSTSKSSPHISFPLIQLFDSHTGNLLVEAYTDDCVYHGNDKLENFIIKGVETTLPPIRQRSHTIHESLRLRDNNNKIPLSRSKSGTSTNSILKLAENHVIDNFVEKFKNLGIKCQVRSKSIPKSNTMIKPNLINSGIIENTDSFNLMNVSVGIQKSKSVNEMVSQNKKKRYSRSSSSVRFTTSFLERVSECRNSSSSSSDTDIQNDSQERRYFYRSSKAGTLLLCEDSFKKFNSTRNRRSRNLDSVIENDDLNVKAKSKNNEKEKLSRNVIKTSKTKKQNDCLNSNEAFNNKNGLISKNCSAIKDYYFLIENPKNTIINNENCNLFVQSENEMKNAVLNNSLQKKYNDDLLQSESKVKTTRLILNRRATNDFNAETSTKRLNNQKRKKRHYSASLEVKNKDRASIASLSSDDENIDRYVKIRDQKLRFSRPEQNEPNDKCYIFDEKPSTANRDFKNDENRQAFHLSNNEANDKYSSRILDAPVKYSDEVLYHLVKQLSSLNKENLVPTTKNTRNLENENNSEINNNVPDTLNRNKLAEKCSDSIPEDIDEDEHRSIVVRAQCNYKPKKKSKYHHIMGSNVSRYSEKGLSGRRAHSSGNLFTGNTTTNTPSKKNQNKKCNKKKTKESATAIDDISDIASISTTIGFPGSYDNASFTDPCIVNDISLQRLYSPSNSRRPKNKVSKQQAYHGSLPNNLDDSENDFVLNNQTAILNNSSCLVDGRRYVDNIDSPMIEPKTDINLIQTNFNIVSHPQSSISEKLQNETQCSQSNNNAGIGSSISMNNQSLLEIKKFRTKLDKMNTNSLSKRCPLNNRSNKDPAYDPGYVSERSPEEESLPSLLLNNCKKMSEHMSNDIPILENSYDFPLPQYVVENESQKYDFITKDSIFSVHIVKGPRGLGLSVSGGIDSNAPFPGLIRIKRLFPHQAAWSVGVLQQGDIILVVNGVQLTGLTNYEALEILRTTPNEVFMIISRPVDERYRKLSPPVEAPPPPVRKHDISVSLDQCHSKFCGEFEIFLTKQQGSLGFTLRKEDEIVAGHCVRALVREPALTDGRIKPGDKILAVNDISIAGMTHEEAVIFLRKATETVKLRLYRDDTMTPLSTVSPTDIERKALNMSSNSKKVVLRPEAINLLSDLAYRKQYSGGDESTGSSINSSSASPRRLKRIQKSPRSSTSGSQGSSSNTFMQQSGTDSDTSTIISHGTTSFRVQQVSSHSSIDYSNNCIVSEPENELEEEFYNEDELLSMVDEDTYYGERPGRPNYLNIPNLLGNTQKFTPKQTQTQFKMANGHELNNLNNEILDAPTVYTISSSQSDMNDEFASLPCETFLVECKNKSDLDQYSKYVSKYGYGNPLYQSSQNSFNNENGSKSLLKWKGTMLSTDNNNENTDSKKDITINKCSETYKTQSGDSNCDIPSISNSSRILSRSTSIDNDINIDSEGKQLITVELNRGWNSRLGFSITKDKNDGHIYISAVYVDSVAARDGRLRKYDRILTVNEELIEGKEKHEVIDLLRTLRGSIVITVTREYHNTQSSYPVNYDIGCETEGEN